MKPSGGQVPQRWSIVFWLSGLIGSDGLHYEKVGDGEPVCIEDELPFALPEGWCWSRLGQLAFYKKGPFGSSLTKSMFVPDGPNTFKVYEQKNAIQHNANLGHYFIAPNKFEELSGFEVLPGEIIVSCAGTIGETYVIPAKSRRGIINQALMKIALYEAEMKQFYLIYFDYVLKNKAAESSKGTALKNIPPFAVLKRFYIPIPPLAEQKRIVVVLDDLLARVDTIEREQAELDALLTKTRSKVLDLAIRGKLVPQDPADEPASVLLERIHAEKLQMVADGKLKKKDIAGDSVIYRGDDNSYYERRLEDGVIKANEVAFYVPKSWCWSRIDSLNLYQGKTETPPNNPSLKYELYSVPAIASGKPEYISGHEIGSSKQVVQQDDLLICKINPKINRVWIVGRFFDGPLLASSEWIVVRSPLLHSGYLRKVFSSPYFRAQILSNVSGVGGSLMRARPSSVKQYAIPIPPITEQERISQVLERIDNILMATR